MPYLSMINNYLLALIRDLKGKALKKVFRKLAKLEDDGKKKPDYSLLPPEAFALGLDPHDLDGVVRVMEFGVKKHGLGVWQTQSIQRFRQACLRHHQAIVGGEQTELESGLPHRWHFLADLVLLFALESRLKNPTRFPGRASYATPSEVHRDDPEG